MGEANASFSALVGQLDYSLFIVTVASGGQRAGCLVGFATQVSIDPQRFLACISNKNHTYRVARGAELLIVHPVPDSAAELAELFGGSTGDDLDKFAQVAWSPGPGGAPILRDLPGWFAGEILDRRELGDHAGFLLAPVAGDAGELGAPFTFRRGRRIEPGHEA